MYKPTGGAAHRKKMAVENDPSIIDVLSVPAKGLVVRRWVVHIFLFVE